MLYPDKQLYICTTLFFATLRIVNPQLFDEINASFNPTTNERQNLPINKIKAFFLQYIQEEPSRNMVFPSSTIQRHIYLDNMMLLIAVASPDISSGHIAGKLGVDHGTVDNYLNTYFHKTAWAKGVAHSHLHELLEAINLV